METVFHCDLDRRALTFIGRGSRISMTRRETSSANILLKKLSNVSAIPDALKVPITFRSVTLPLGSSPYPETGSLHQGTSACPQKTY